MSTGSLTEKVKDPPFSSHFQEKARRDLPVAGLLPQCLKHSGLLQVKAGSPDLNVSLSGGWGDPCARALPSAPWGTDT